MAIPLPTLLTYISATIGVCGGTPFIIKGCKAWRKSVLQARKDRVYSIVNERNAKQMEEIKHLFLCSHLTHEIGNYYDTYVKEGAVPCEAEIISIDKLLIKAAANKVNGSTHMKQEALRLLVNKYLQG